jgi:hypothetical protein
MMYPHMLLILILIMAASVSAADAAVTKWKTADYLTDYYEMRIVELMALRRILESPDPKNFTIKTNVGTTSAVMETAEKENWKIRIATQSQEGSFQAAYLYDPESRSVLGRIEYH